VATACDDSVKLARRYGHRGTAGPVYAVLRRLARAGLPPMPDIDADPAVNTLLKRTPGLLREHPPGSFVARLPREGE